MEEFLLEKLAELNIFYELSNDDSRGIEVVTIALESVSKMQLVQLFSLTELEMFYFEINEEYITILLLECQKQEEMGL
jgi:hypothetical protein